MPKRKTQEEFEREVKNANPYMIIVGVYENGNSKVKCTCSVCGYSWRSTARNLIKETKCSKCLNKSRKLKPLDLTHDEFVAKVFEINPHIRILGTYRQGLATILCICLNDNYKSRIRCNLLLKPYMCLICKNGKENVKLGINDIHSVNPILGEMLLDYEDGFRYKVDSKAKVDFKCLNCGSVIRNKAITNVHRRGLSCKCSDGKSFPEKYVFSVLSQITDYIEMELIINNNNSYKYDFYGFTPENRTWIVEVMGKQHSEKSFETRGGRSLEKEIQNDIEKYEYAKQNNIDFYITIDAHDTCYLSMQRSILKSGLGDIFNLSNINWEKAYRYALSSRVVECSKLWDIGLRVYEIAKQLSIDRHTVYRYLNKAASINLCSYNSKSNGKLKVICINTGEIFNSLREAEIKYKIKKGYLSGYLKDKNRKRISGEINGTKLIWEYYDEYKGTQNIAVLSA